MKTLTALKKLSMAAAGAAVIFSGIGYSKPASASLIGDTVDCSIIPNGTFWSCNPTSATVVDPGNEFTLKLVGNDFFSVDIGASSISLNYINAGSLDAGAGELLTLSDLDWVDAPGEIVGFSLDVFGDVTGLLASDITFGAHSVSIDFNNTFWQPGASAVITLETVHKSVPEPSSVLGLLAIGTLGAGSILKRKLK